MPTTTDSNANNVQNQQRSIHFLRIKIAKTQTNAYSSHSITIYFYYYK